MRFLVLLLLLAAPALGQDEDEADNPWVDGPEAPEPDEDLEAVQAPNESGARERLDAPPLPPDLTRPASTSLPPPPRDLRLSTSLDRERLLRFGDQNLPEAVAWQLPGLWLLRNESGVPRPSARGHGNAQLEVRLDEVPLLNASAYPAFPLVGLLSIAEVERATLRHGPRLGGGASASSAGALLLESQALPANLGVGLPLTAELRGGFGGPDLEKTLALRGVTGYGAVRLGFTADLYDRDELRLGRGETLLDATGVLGGHLGARAEIDLDGLRLFSRWRAARHIDSPLTAECPEVGGRISRCIVVDERAHDLLLSGADLTLGNLSLGLRAHAQRFDERLRRSGSGLINVERDLDETWRTGARGFAKLDAGGLRLDADLEWLHDRVRSTHLVRSRRAVDAAPSGDGRSDPSRARRVDGASVSTGRATAGAGLDLGALELRAALEGVVTTRAVPADDAPTSDARLAWGGELTARARLAPELALFSSVTRTARPPPLDALARVRDDFRSAPTLPAPDEGAPVDHTLEVGAEAALRWLELAVVGWGSLRSGVLQELEVEDEDGGSTLRLLETAPRQAAGLEGRLAWRSRPTGLEADAVFGLVLVDEGADFATATPVTGVPPPLGALTLSWAPPGSPFSIWGRARTLFPQARLSPGEQLDDALCPESNQDPQTDPCRGAAFASIFDVGVSVQPSDALRLDGTVTNLGDLSYRMHGQPLPGGGLGARVVLTLGL